MISEWKYNPLAGPLHGVVWERLIGLVGGAMNVTLREQVIDDERLSTRMCEVESILNSCQITRASDQCNDLEALKLNHLLIQ